MSTGLIARWLERYADAGTKRAGDNIRRSAVEGCADELAKAVEQITQLEVVVPSELEGEERWNRNGEYVLRDAVLAILDGREGK